MFEMFDIVFCVNYYSVSQGMNPPGTRALKKFYNFSVVFDGAMTNTNTKKLCIFDRVNHNLSDFHKKNP